MPERRNLRVSPCISTQLMLQSPHDEMDLTEDLIYSPGLEMR